MCLICRLFCQNNSRIGHYCVLLININGTVKEMCDEIVTIAKEIYITTVIFGDSLYKFKTQ